MIAILAALELAACASDDSHRRSTERDGGPDAAATGGSAGLDTSGIGGKAGGGGAGGTAGEAGAPDSSVPDSSVPDSSVPDSSVPDSSVPEAGPQDDGGVRCPPLPGPLVDAGADAAPNQSTLLQWKSWSANTCESCPSSRPILCDDLGQGATFDVASRVLRIALPPGTAQLTGATVSFLYNSQEPDGGAYDYFQGVDTQTFIVDKDTLTLDLSATVPSGVLQLYQLQLELTDACGTVTNLDDELYWTQIYPSDGGPPSFNFLCEG